MGNSNRTIQLFGMRLAILFIVSITLSACGGGQPPDAMRARLEDWVSEHGEYQGGDVYTIDAGGYQITGAQQGKSVTGEEDEVWCLKTSGIWRNQYSNSSEAERLTPLTDELFWIVTRKNLLWEIEAPWGLRNENYSLGAPQSMIEDDFNEHNCQFPT